MQYLHGTNFTEGPHWCEGIISEGNGFISRDDVTIAQGQTIVPGSVLGKVTATGQYVAYNPAATDGSQTAVAIALYPATTGASQTATIAALTRNAEFRSGSLMWAAGTTSGQITTGIGQLVAQGLIIRATIAADH